MGAPHPWSSTVPISSALRRGRVASPSWRWRCCRHPLGLGAPGVPGHADPSPSTPARSGSARARPAAGLAADICVCRRGPRKFNQIRNSLSERRRLENVPIIALAPSIARPRLQRRSWRDAGATAGWARGMGRAATPGPRHPGVLGGGRERSRGSRWEQGKGQGRASRARQEPAARWLRTGPSRRSRRCLRCRLTAKVSRAPGSGGEARKRDEAAALGRSPPCPGCVRPQPSTLHPHPARSQPHTPPARHARPHAHPVPLTPLPAPCTSPAAPRSPQPHVPPRARGHACSDVLRLLTLSALINTADKGRGAGAAGGYLLQAAGPPRRPRRAPLGIQTKAPVWGSPKGDGAHGPRAPPVVHPLQAGLVSAAEPWHMASSGPATSSIPPWLPAPITRGRVSLCGDTAGGARPWPRPRLLSLPITSAVGRSAFRRHRRRSRGSPGVACFRGDFLTLRRFHSKEISRARWERFPSTLPTSVAALV